WPRRSSRWSKRWSRTQRPTPTPGRRQMAEATSWGSARYRYEPVDEKLERRIDPIRNSRGKTVHQQPAYGADDQLRGARRLNRREPLCDRQLRRHIHPRIERGENLG